MAKKTPTENSDSAALSGRLHPAGSALVVVPLDTPSECLAEIRGAGMVPICTDKPESVRLLAAESQVAHSDMVMAALKALCGDLAETERRIFIRDLHTRMLAREQNLPVSHAENNQTTTPQ